MLVQFTVKLYLFKMYKYGNVCVLSCFKSRRMKSIIDDGDRYSVSGCCKINNT